MGLTYPLNASCQDEATASLARPQTNTCMRSLRGATAPPPWLLSCFIFLGTIIAFVAGPPHSATKD